MSDVRVIPPRPVQAADPLTELSMDELRDTLVPTQEEELPQGVLELMAALILRHRPVMETVRAVNGQSIVNVQDAVDVELDGTRTSPPTSVSYPQIDRLIGKLTQQPLPRTMEPVAPSPGNLIAPAQLQPDSAMTVEPLPTDSAASASLNLDVLRVPQSPQQTSQITRSTIPLPAPQPPLPVPDLTPETFPVSDRGLLQVPFNKGSASGQVTISRLPDESVRPLQLSPSNALVFEQLKGPFELIREPAWRLTDRGGEQRQDSRQSPDDEQNEDAEYPA